jgi:hypothetical protein
MKLRSTILLMLATIYGYAQTGKITGRVIDKASQETLIGVTLILENTSPPYGTSTDVEGKFTVTAPAGSYNITASFVGYKTLTKFNVPVSSGNINSINFEMEEELTTLGEVVVQGNRSAAATTLETPLSIQRLTTEEIKSNPGGNFDISRVIQALPGVGGATGSASFRNDIVIRGGAPNENVYYLDGIEIPVINHFSTQGSAGGPQGILNVSFIEDVTLSTSAFESRYDNVLSSVLQFKQREGNTSKLQGNIRLSATELAATFDGPISKKTTFLASARRSYLELLFKAIDLPIRPNYWDFQYKVTHKFNAKTTLNAIGVGAIDEFSFALPKKSTPENEYVLRSNPLINQKSYTLGLSLKHLVDKGFYTLSFSRNYFENGLDKFEDARNGVESLRTLKVRSKEIENKLRFDVNKTFTNWKYTAGLALQYVEFKNDVYNKIRKEITDNTGVVVQPGIEINFNSEISFFKAGIFGQVSRTFFSNKLSASAGVRSDANSFTNSGENPLKTLSPRISASYFINSQWSINASVGRYYKVPIYTVLGYRDANNQYINSSNEYIQSTHYVGGLEFLPIPTLRFTVEGFFKHYDNYPVSIRDGISIANQGSEFGAIGNEAIASTGKGRAYGVELFAQQKLTKNIFFTFSYTLFTSEFSGLSGAFVSSAWNTKNLASVILGKKFKRNWELGLKVRYAGGSPYTPFDLEASQKNYASLGTGVLDYGQLNSQRLDPFKQVDLRIDKKWNFKSVALDVYVDVQNIFNFKPTGSLSYTFKRNADNTGFATTDGNPLQVDGANAIPIVLKETNATVLPTIGFVIEF